MGADVTETGKLRVEDNVFARGRVRESGVQITVGFQVGMIISGVWCTAVIWLAQSKMT